MAGATWFRFGKTRQMKTKKVSKSLAPVWHEADLRIGTLSRAVRTLMSADTGYIGTNLTGARFLSFGSGAERQSGRSDETLR
jgi:hypothetical protein